ncbi:MAG: hypothetical protein A2Y22_03960 [Clostridiales bacterium GWD2_32_59]|nr:MAG: hypothetical protein A2Y22_03960 [Clostridiales bacterium GWD2_32_59]
MNKALKIQSNKRRGFTLLELLAVLVILAALATIAIPIFTNKSNEAKQVAHDENIRTLQKQAQMYMLSHESVGDSDDIIDAMVAEGFIKERPTYPINPTYTYVVKVESGKAIIETNEPPTPTLSITASTPDTTSAISIIYTFTFSTSVTGFDDTDISVTNGTKGAFAGSGTTYTLEVTNEGVGVTQRISVADGAATATVGGIASTAGSKDIVLALTGADIVVGKYIKFGRYKINPADVGETGEDIIWRVINKEDKNGDEIDELMLVSDKIITFKAFDASGLNSGYGDNYWPSSNIRDWLNSNQSAGNVSWTHAGPTLSNNSGYNNYEAKAGFLANFTVQEQEKIVPVSLTTPTRTVSGYDGTPVITNDEKVFLLAESELPLLTVAGYANYIAQATQKAIDEGNDILMEPPNISTAWVYFTRTPYLSNAAYVQYVYTNGTMSECLAYDGFRGVRPSLYLNSSSMMLGAENGATAATAYTITNLN